MTDESTTCKTCFFRDYPDDFHRCHVCVVVSDSGEKTFSRWKQDSSPVPLYIYSLERQEATFGEYRKFIVSARTETEARQVVAKHIIRDRIKQFGIPRIPGTLTETALWRDCPCTQLGLLDSQLPADDPLFKDPCVLSYQIQLEEGSNNDSDSVT